MRLKLTDKHMALNRLPIKFKNDIIKRLQGGKPVTEPKEPEG